MGAHQAGGLEGNPRLLGRQDAPVRGVGQGPGDDVALLLVIGVAGLEAPLGGGGAVADAEPAGLVRLEGEGDAAQRGMGTFS